MGPMNPPTNLSFGDKVSLALSMLNPFTLAAKATHISSASLADEERHADVITRTLDLSDEDSHDAGPAGLMLAGESVSESVKDSTSTQTVNGEPKITRRAERPGDEGEDQSAQERIRAERKAFRAKVQKARSEGCKYIKNTKRTKHVCDELYFTEFWDECEVCLDEDLICFDECIPAFPMNPMPIALPSPPPTEEPIEVRNPTKEGEAGRCKLNTIKKIGKRCDEWFEEDEQEYDACSACSMKTFHDLYYVPHCWDACSPYGPPPIAILPTVPPTPEPTPPPAPSFDPLPEGETCSYVLEDDALTKCAEYFDTDEDVYDMCSACIEGPKEGKTPTCFDPCLPPILQKPPGDDATEAPEKAESTPSDGEGSAGSAGSEGSEGSEGFEGSEGSDATTAAPAADGTSAAAAATTAAAGDGTTVAPSATTAAAADGTTAAPSGTTAAAADDTTVAPSATTAAAADSTTVAPSATTAAAADGTTVAPSATTAAAAAAGTTAAPSGTTAAAAADTTAAAVDGTTAAPSATTAAAAATTAAVAGGTTAAPSGTTAAAAAGTTGAPAAATTAAPVV